MPYIKLNIFHCYLLDFFLTLMTGGRDKFLMNHLYRVIKFIYKPGKNVIGNS